MQSTARPLVIGRAFQLKNGSLSCPMARAKSKTPPCTNVQREPNVQAATQRRAARGQGRGEKAEAPANERCEKLLSIFEYFGFDGFTEFCVSLSGVSLAVAYPYEVRSAPRSPRGDTRDRTTRDMLDLCDHKQGAVWTVDARSIRVNAHHH